jgi:hypothetical protein
MMMKTSYDPGDQAQLGLVEELRHIPQVGDQLEELTAWTKASEIEQARWSRAGQAVEARASGGMYDLVEELISDRAFGRAAGVYLDAGAELEDLVYAARRLLQAGQKVVLLDWDVTRGAGEELLNGGRHGSHVRFNSWGPGGCLGSFDPGRNSSGADLPGPGVAAGDDLAGAELMTPGQREMLELILETRQLAPEIILAVRLLLDQEDGAVTKDQVHSLVMDLLVAPEIEDADVTVGGIIHG